MLDDYFDTSMYPARLHIQASQPLYAALTAQNITLRNAPILIPFNGRMLLVYRTSDAMSPTAVYVDAKTASWNHDSIVLDTGLTLTDEGWHDADGQPQTVARPMQLLMR